MEIVHKNPLWINDETAKSMLIQEGDQVRITSALGALTTPIFITQGIHPEWCSL